jgi:hypothetical protein
MSPLGLLCLHDLMHKCTIEYLKLIAARKVHRIRMLKARMSRSQAPGSLAVGLGWTY